MSGVGVIGSSFSKRAIARLGLPEAAGAVMFRERFEAGPGAFGSLRIMPAAARLQGCVVRILLSHRASPFSRWTEGPRDPLENMRASAQPLKE